MGWEERQKFESVEDFIGSAAQCPRYFLENSVTIVEFTLLDADRSCLWVKKKILQNKGIIKTMGTNFLFYQYSRKKFPILSNTKTN